MFGIARHRAFTDKGFCPRTSLALSRGPKPSTPTLYLCGGLQSSGSTLVSWCFLQRADMSGVLDAYNDVLPWFDPQGRTDLLWCKTTIGCFRLIEVIRHFQDCGWNVPPLLIVRDVRKVWASLVGKTYGLNGLTAEDPPLRLRFRRFLSDWELFRDEGWPILRYESLVADPKKTLRQACQDLALPWDDGMVRWPKAPRTSPAPRTGTEPSGPPAATVCGKRSTVMSSTSPPRWSPPRTGNGWRKSSASSTRLITIPVPWKFPPPGTTAPLVSFRDST